MNEFLESTLPVLDRSTLERFANCPAQGVLSLGVPEVVGYAAVIGEECHRAISRAIQSYVDAGGMMGAREFREALEMECRCARPDVQPAVIEAMRSVLWRLSERIAGQEGIAVANVRKFDGGEGARSGQIAAEFDGTVNLTCEVDLLSDTSSPEVMAVDDWKTGWKLHDADGVARSFQFGFYSWVVLQNYPSIQAVKVVVWNTRTGRPTYPVYFRRDAMDAVVTRLRFAVGEWQRATRDPKNAPAWPAVEKCRICSVVRRCPAAERAIAEVEADPTGFLDAMVSVAAKLEAMEGAAAAFVDRTGKSIVSGSSAFGRDKPKSERKSPAALYQRKGGDDGDE